MAEIISDHIWYPDGYPGPAYDLRYIVTWVIPTDAPAAVDVHFTGDSVFVVRFPSRVDFLAAKNASLAAGG